ncbi:glycosyltransferase [Leptothermofonsia sp. ETS-13]|uniref:glycosyltransferase n=1 Tax=Leptothermofonsia sp. ETS-13 TaxID=3035696 RepID=UPI003BA2AB6E
MEKRNQDFVTQLTLENPPKTRSSTRRRVLFVQYAGDYREAVNHLNQGGNETYYAQRYSVNTMAEISQQVEEMTVLVCHTDEPYNEVLENRVRAIGSGFATNVPVKELIKLVEQQKPTHLIINTPILELVQWAIRNKVKTLALLADSFQATGVRSTLKNYFLGRLLNHPQIDWVANHGTNACRSLRAIGVNPNKIIPWDWPHVITPDNFTPKQLRTHHGTFKLLYVGSIIDLKGVGDVLEAVPILNAKNISTYVQLAGKGDIARYIEQAKKLGIEQQIEFLGFIPNNNIVQLMRAADLVMIPSHHSYPEGLPMIIYEALCSHTPIVASDHPMFRRKLIDGQSALIFRAGNASALAERIVTLLSNPDLYQRLSANSKATWEQLQVPVKFADLLNRWIFDSPTNRQWLYNHRFASERYDIYIS